MYLLFSILIVFACIFLILIVLVQNSKGGGLASNFSSSNQVMGVRKTADFLEKATWSLAIALVVLTLAASFAIPRPDKGASRSANIPELIPQERWATETPTWESEEETPEQ